MGRRVLVVGGGIAGASVAALLGQAGDQVTLVEIDQGRRTSGAPVDVRGIAHSVVERLGVTSKLRSADTGVRHAEFVDQRGRVRARAKMRRDARTDVEISRSVLNQILLERAADVADIVYADGPERLVPDANGVDVTLHSGSELRFDLIIGADGQHSMVRRLVFGPESEYSRPFGLCIATVAVDAALVAATDVVQICNVPGACMSVHPAGGHALAALIFRAPGAPRPAERAEQERILEDNFGHRGWKSHELLQAVAVADDLYFDTVTRVRVPHWSRGRVVLLGDAASSLTILGEGCSMAIAGAGAFADALADSADVEAALAAYERTHRPEVSKNQRGAGYGASVLVPKTTAGIALRNTLVRIVRSV